METMTRKKTLNEILQDFHEIEEMLIDFSGEITDEIKRLFKEKSYLCHYSLHLWHGFQSILECLSFDETLKPFMESCLEFAHDLQIVTNTWGQISQISKSIEQYLEQREIVKKAIGGGLINRLNSKSYLIGSMLVTPKSTMLLQP